MAYALQALAPTVTLVDGIPSTTSIEVAQHFGKSHDDVLRRIRNLVAQLDGEYLRNFAEVTHEYSNGKGGTQTAPAYRLTRDGFTLLAMGFTGKKALQFKLAYIEAFNRMEAALRSPQPATITPAQQQTLKGMVGLVANATGLSHQEVWTRLHLRFQVARYDQLPADQFAGAKEYLQSEVEHDEGAMARLAGAAFLRGRRFVLTFDHLGRPVLDQISAGEAIVRCDDIPGLINAGFVPRQCLPDLLTAAARQLAR